MRLLNYLVWVFQSRYNILSELGGIFTKFLMVFRERVLSSSDWYFMNFVGSI